MTKVHENWVDQGLNIVKAVQARHDGIRRNPWSQLPPAQGGMACKSKAWCSMLIPIIGWLKAALAGIAPARRLGVERFTTPTAGVNRIRSVVKLRRSRVSLQAAWAWMGSAFPAKHRHCF